MKVGSVKEIKRHEYRVGLTPANAKAYIPPKGMQLLRRYGLYSSRNRCVPQRNE